MTVLTPVIFVVNQLSFLVLKLLRVDVKAKGESITEDELRTIVEVSHEEGVIESEEKKMINNVFDFGDAVARDVMLPKVNMTFVDVDATYDELMEVFRSEKYTRYPVYEETTDNVIGVLNIKDIFLKGGEEGFSVRKYLRKPLYTYEFKKVAELMREMRKAAISIVIVLDEYGSTVGLITLEDMLEEIVGEFCDEYDDDEQQYVKIDDNTYIFEGKTLLNDFYKITGIDENDFNEISEDAETLAGLILEIKEDFPAEKEKICYGKYLFTILEVDKRRIIKIKVRIDREEKE